MPTGRYLPDASWARRHNAIMALLLVMVALTIPFGLLVDMPIRFSPMVVLPSLMIYGIASRARSREWKSVLATLGLFISASTFVYLANGVTEAHFLYFVLVGVISLYQDWRPFLVGLALVVMNHAVFGYVFPAAVFNSHSAGMSLAQTVELSLVHSAFIVASSVASIVAWKASEVQALSDELTGLPNRRLLSNELERLLASSSELAVSVLFVDLCGFKKINDVYGHEAGDRLLTEVSHRLQRTTRKQDFVARIGADEFAIVLPGAGGADAISAARRVATSCAEPIAINNRTLRVTASVGVITVPSERRVSAADALRNADLAMYAAKKGFGDTGGFQVFGAEMWDEACAAFELELDLVSCVANNELFLEFQPIVDMVSLRIVGVEALVRWQHPTLGWLSPMVFIPLAERTGAIIEIGDWVLAESGRQLANWISRFHECASLRMHVNLSTYQLRDPDLIKRVRRTCVESDMPAGNFVLEITESALLGGEVDLAALRALKDLGVRLALDDFGTGYSSLSHLARLPIDDLKIDKSFTDDVPAGPNRSLMAGVLALAGQVDMTAVVEGVERPEQVRELLAMGARFAQGFYFSRPLSSNAIIEKLRLQCLTRVAPAEFQTPR